MEEMRLKTTKQCATSIRLAEDTIRKINELFMGESSFTRKIEGCVDYLYAIYAEQLDLLKGYFSVVEAGYLASVFNGLLYSITDLEIVHARLLQSYEDSIIYGTAFVSDETVDFEKLREKLQSLSMVQASIVENSMVEFWESQCTEDKMNISDMYIVDSMDHKYLICIKCDEHEDLKNAFSSLFLLLEKEDFTPTMNETYDSIDNSIKINCSHKNGLTVSGRMELKEKINTTLRDINVVADINII